MPNQQWKTVTAAVVVPASETSSTPVATDGPTVGPTVTADEVGASFALQYFKIMKSRPEDLHCFYNQDSRVTRGSPNAAGVIDVKQAVGPSQIRDLLYKKHCCGPRLVLAYITNLESQESCNGSIMVQIAGILRFADDACRPFFMSTYLVQQGNSTAFDYYALNDILIFRGKLVSDSPEMAQIPALMTQEPSDENRTESVESLPEPAKKTEPPAKREAPDVVVGVPLCPETDVVDKTESKDICGKDAEMPVKEEPKERKSAWKKTPVAVNSLAAQQGFVDIGTVPQPQLSGNSTDIATSLSSSSTKPFVPVDSSNYAATSYAAKLLHADGQRAAPCLTGFAIPHAAPRDSSERRPSYRSRRGKTLWIAPLPAEISDEQIKRAVSDSLRGQFSEGHVVRLERHTVDHFAFIELDTEMCASLLRQKGFCLQGKDVRVEYPRLSRGDYAGRVPVKQEEGRRRGNNQQRSGNRFTPPAVEKAPVADEEGWTPATRHARSNQQPAERRPSHGNNRNDRDDRNARPQGQPRTQQRAQGRPRPQGGRQAQGEPRVQGGRQAQAVIA